MVISIAMHRGHPASGVVLSYGLDRFHCRLLKLAKGHWYLEQTFITVISFRAFALLST